VNSGPATGIGANKDPRPRISSWFPRNCAEFAAVEHSVFVLTPGPAVLVLFLGRKIRFQPCFMLITDQPLVCASSTRCEDAAGLVHHRDSHLARGVVNCNRTTLRGVAVRIELAAVSARLLGSAFSDFQIESFRAPFARTNETVSRYSSPESSPISMDRRNCQF
jgi:hypothetical protein